MGGSAAWGAIQLCNVVTRAWLSAKGLEDEGPIRRTSIVCIDHGSIGFGLTTSSQIDPKHGESHSATALRDDTLHGFGLLPLTTIEAARISTCTTRPTSHNCRIHNVRCSAMLRLPTLDNIRSDQTRQDETKLHSTTRLPTNRPLTISRAASLDQQAFSKHALKLHGLSTAATHGAARAASAWRWQRGGALGRVPEK